MLINIKKNYFLLVSIFLILYFIFNLLDGERGLFSYLDKNKKLKSLKDEEFYYNQKISNYENKNLLLSENLDKDFIDILIREKFFFGKENEKIYIIKNNEN